MSDSNGKKNEIIDVAKTQAKKAVQKAKTVHPVKKLKRRYASHLENEGIEINQYSKAAVNAWVIGIISIIALIALMLCVAVFGGKDMSFNSMYYLYRDVNSMGRIGAGENTRLDYTIPKKNQDFALFKNGLCVAGDGEIQIFNKTGNQTMSVTTSYSEPKVVSAKDYIVVYDLGGRGFCAYNSFAEIYSEKREYPISTVALSYEGKLCVVGQTQSYNCELTVYDESFGREFTYSRNDYAIDCDFDSAGRNIVLCTLSSSDGAYLVNLTLIDTKKQEVKARLEVEDILPYECKYIGNDRIALICSDRVLIYNEKMELKGEYRYPRHELSDIAVSDDAIALMFTTDKLNKKSLVVVIDSKAKEKMEYEHIGAYSDMTMYGGYVYIAESEGILRVDCGSQNESFAELEARGGKLLVCNKDRVILARESVADVVVSFGAK